MSGYKKKQYSEWLNKTHMLFSSKGQFLKQGKSLEFTLTMSLGWHHQENMYIASQTLRSIMSILQLKKQTQRGSMACLRARGQEVGEWGFEPWMACSPTQPCILQVSLPDSGGDLGPSSKVLAPARD